MGYPTRGISNTLNGGTGTSIVLTKPSGLQDGDVLLIKLRGQGTSAATPVSAACTGFTALNGASASDRIHMMLYKVVSSAASEASTYTVSTNGTSGRVAASIEIVRGVDTASPISGTKNYMGLSPNPASLTSWTVDSAVDKLLIIEMRSDERTSGQSHVPTAIPSGYTTGLNFQSSLDASTSGSRTAIWSGYKESIGTTSIASTSLTWATGITAVRGSAVAFRGKADEGYPVVFGDGTEGLMTYIDTDGSTQKTPSSVNIWYPSFTDVSDLLANTNGPTMAHRGGSTVYPEMSEYAYDHSVFNGYGVLEFSVGWSSDNVPFGLGHQYLDEITGSPGGTSQSPSAMDWATISALENHLLPVSPGVYQPIFRLDDFLAKYGQSHICIIDPKYGFANQTKLDIMFDMMDTYGGPDRFIAKFDSSETDAKLSTTASNGGYERMNYWSSDTTAMAAQQSRWSIIGALYSDSSAMTQAGTYGKPVWGAIVPDAAGYTTARSNGADLVMCRNTLAIPAVSSWN